MLSLKFHKIEGFQDTRLGAYSPPKFKQLNLDNKAVQILNIKNSHRICVQITRINGKTIEIEIADSLDYGYEDIISQVSSMVRETNIRNIKDIKLDCSF